MHNDAETEFMRLAVILFLVTGARSAQVRISAPLGLIGSSMVIDRQGNIYMTGVDGFGVQPTSGAFQTKPNPKNCPATQFAPPCHDSFIVKLDPTGSRLI